MVRWRPPAPLPLVAALALTGCSPALDWREVRPRGSGATLLMPCKPDELARSVSLAGTTVRLQLAACSAGGQTWALAHADVGDPAQVTPALAELRAAAAANLDAGDGAALPLQVRGATPNRASERVQFSGKLPDGRAAHEQVAVFARGTRVFQATVLGEQLSAEAADTFFGALQAGGGGASSP